MPNKNMGYTVVTKTVCTAWNIVITLKSTSRTQWIMSQWVLGSTPTWTKCGLEETVTCQVTAS